MNRYLLTIDAEVLRDALHTARLTPALRDALATARPLTPRGSVPRGNRLATRLRPHLDRLLAHDHVLVPVPADATHDRVSHCVRDWARYRKIVVAVRSAQDVVHAFVLTREAAT
jgi:hypothetical protein